MEFDRGFEPHDQVQPGAGGPHLGVPRQCVAGEDGFEAGVESAGVRRRREVWVAWPEQSGVEGQEDTVEDGDPLPGHLDDGRRALPLLVITRLPYILGPG